MWECQYTQNIIKRICLTLLPDEFLTSLNKRSFLLGTGDQRLDNVYLIIKMYVYISRKSKKQFSESEFKNELALRIHSDYTKMNEYRFANKWHGLEHFKENVLLI